jgi:transcriptional regulator with XRE-family HTH domain
VTVAERFAANLHRCRWNRGMSQEELGFAAGLHRTEISQLERGLRCPRIDTLAKLCGALGVGPDELMTGIEWTPAKQQPGHFGAADS